MRVRYDIALVSPFLLLFLLSLAACGGGGGGSASAGVSPAPSASLFDGDYHFVSFGITDAGAVLGTSQWGQFTADGAGGLSGTASLNLNGGVTTGAPSAPLLYAVDADHTLRVQVATDPSVDTLVGGISTDGRAYTLGTVRSGANPYLMIGAQKAGTYAAADLTGRYHVAAMIADSSGPQQIAFWGTADFDGSGTVDFEADLNANGTLAAIPANTGSYTVGPDGDVTWSLGGSPDVLEGGMLGAGELVILGGMSNTGGNPSIFVLVPYTFGASDATLSGTYRFVGIEATSTNTFESRTGTLVADGAGGLTAELTNNADGVITTMSSGALTYAVGPAGGLTVDGDAVLSGGVSGDGRFFVLAGGTSASDNPTIVVGVR
ncbi:MAG: hypothetical protein QNJ98_12570 [Planctomycetota bacterium]|nr:hypothetical protein [Planctomycetota bacterium]